MTGPPGMIDFSSESSTTSQPSDDVLVESRKPSSPSPSPATATPERRPSRLVFPLLVVLVPACVAGVLAWPVLVVCCLIPVLGFFAVPSLISLSIFLIYALTWTSYLVLAQVDPPANVSLPFLPLSPIRCTRVVLHLLRLVREFLIAGAIDLFLDLQVRRVMVLGGKDANRVVKENVLYAEGGRRLDVYLPLGTRAEGDAEEPPRQLAPVVVFVGGGNWAWWRKKWGSQAALRLRRLGYAVVVPDIAQWPEARSSQMVIDVRRVLEWSGERIQGYGGDPHQIFILGYGSGAHISLLTIVQDAVVRSRDEHLARTAKPSKVVDAAPAIEVSSGIRRCKIWGEDARLPPIAGLIFVSGVFDIIKQMRFEVKAGIEDLSSLRRACGPSTASALLSCPSHLLFGAKEILEPDRLPPKVLIIAGGEDSQVPYAQSVLLRTLFEGVGIPVRLKLYRDETHLGSLASLMHQTRYSSLILQEIESLVSSEVPERLYR